MQKNHAVVSKTAYYIDFIERATQDTGETLDGDKLYELANDCATMAVSPTGEEALEMWFATVKKAETNRAETRAAKRAAAKAERSKRRAETMRRKKESRRNGKMSRKDHKPCDRPARHTNEKPVPIAA